MNKLEQLHLFLRFHFAPWGAAKGEVWETCCSYPYTDESVLKVARDILDGTPGLSEDEIKYLRIVADPPTFATRDVEFAMRLGEMIKPHEGDAEAIHSTADEFLCAVLDGLGYKQLVEVYRGLPRWYG